jgi:hypothetical protein
MGNIAKDKSLAARRLQYVFTGNRSSESKATNKWLGLIDLIKFPNSDKKPVQTLIGSPCGKNNPPPLALTTEKCDFIAKKCPRNAHQ